MARIVFVSGLYVGDIAPYVVPARLLASKGHDVEFVAPSGSHALFAGESFTVSAYPLDCSAERIAADPLYQRLMRHPVRNVARISRLLCRVAFVDNLDAVRIGLLERFEGADVIVTHPTFSAVVSPCARHLRVPLVVGNIFPMLIPTHQWACPIGRRSPNFGGTANKLLWKAFTAGSGRLFYDTELNKYRAVLGQAKRRANTVTACLEADANLTLLPSGYFGEPATDWPATTVVGGFSHWSGPTGQRQDPAVDAFLNAGNSPVLVTLGSSAASGNPDQFATIANGLDQLGFRSLLLVGSTANLLAVPGREGAFVFAPIHEVVGRCRSAVVSGSLGTLAAALSAGVPVVVVPQLFDQIWHGGRVEALGVGILARSPKDVASAIARIENDPTFRQRAKALATIINTQDGAHRLAELIEEQLQNKQR